MAEIANQDFANDDETREADQTREQPDQAVDAATPLVSRAPSCTFFAAAAQSSEPSAPSYDEKLDFIKECNFLRWVRLTANEQPEFRCPILHELMIDPMLGTDTHSYERSAIIHALSINPVNPMNNSTFMTEKDLLPNGSLKRIIDAYREEIDRVYNQFIVTQPKTLVLKK